MLAGIFVYILFALTDLRNVVSRWFSAVKSKYNIFSFYCFTGRGLGKQFKKNKT